MCLINGDDREEERRGLRREERRGERIEAMRDAF